MNEPNYTEDKALISATLERHDAEIDELFKSRNEHSTELAVLRVKAGIWGAAAGAIPVAIALIIWAVQKALH